MTAYATRDDVFQLALSAQAFVSLARPFDGADTQGVIRLKAHGFSSLDTVTLEVSDGGTLPTALSAYTLYYPIPISADLFKISSTRGGSALTWVSIGSGWAIAVDPYRRLDCHLEAEAAIIDEHLTAHNPPILPDPITGLYPMVLRTINARRAARAAVISLQIENAEYRVSVDRLFKQEEEEMRILADWKSGKPVQPRPTDQNTTADNSAIAGSGREAIPWNDGYV